MSSCNTNKKIKSCFCIGADRCNDVNCKIVKEDKEKKQGISIDELSKIYGGILNIPLGGRK